MQGEDTERLKILCEKAAVELDHDELIRLVREITTLLDRKEKKIAEARSHSGKNLGVPDYLGSLGSRLG